MAISVTHQMSRRLKRHIGVDRYFRHNTVASLVNNIAGHGKEIHIKKQLTEQTVLSFGTTLMVYIAI